MSGLGDWLQMEVLGGHVFHSHGACDWKATLASTFEKEAEFWGFNSCKDAICSQENVAMARGVMKVIRTQEL